MLLSRVRGIVAKATKHMEEIFNYIILLFSLIAVVLASGVVWRVEKKLDVSYKFILIALVIFTLGVLADILEFYAIIPPWQWQKVVKAFFIVFVTLGVFEMRSLIIGLEEKEKK